MHGEAGRLFRPEQFAGLPEAARRYLEHAIAPETPLASAVRLRMRGEIKLKGWLPFQAEQVLRWERGTIWSATVRMNGLPIRGSDRFVDGEGAMQWKLFGLFPVMTASGPDISRSAAGRFQAELIWLPSALCAPAVSWTAPDPRRANARFPLQDQPADLTLTLDDQGRLQSVRLARWGNPDSTGFRPLDFGGFAEAETAFGGFTIPTRLRVGWYVGTPRFETEGEFFRATVEDAVYR